MAPPIGVPEGESQCQDLPSEIWPARSSLIGRPSSRTRTQDSCVIFWSRGWARSQYATPGADVWRPCRRGGRSGTRGGCVNDDLAAERESDPQRVWRSRGHGERGRGGDEEGHEAEESPSHEGAVRARGEVSVEMQGVQRLSAREAAQSMQGVRWCVNLPARS